MVKDQRLTVIDHWPALICSTAIYIDMWCVLQSGTFHNLTKNNTLPLVILAFFNEPNGNKSEWTSHIWIHIQNQPISVLTNSCSKNCDENCSSKVAKQFVLLSKSSNTIQKINCFTGISQECWSEMELATF